ncbi:MAG: hypothetical protein A2521_08545 [Deltaproteobacteria bacterium RIFOXYD12_FULL_57_12]|nr:MAG: hypothetical protein A2521_08545 [Deltaproteobacteria bacterium RIFOXYD12_FULL_57_12]
MTNKEKSRYGEPEVLKEILRRTLCGKKFRLDCGHHVTFGQVLGNDVTIRNGKRFKIICAQCGY